LNLLKFIFIFLVVVFLSHNVFAGEQQTLAEFWLALEQKDNTDGIRSTFKMHHIDRGTIQIVKIRVPGGIVAIGKKTPAESGRIAIQLPKLYNRKGVEFLIREVLVPENYLAVGTSTYDESTLIPVKSEDVKRLSDPFLSDEAFQALYQNLIHADEPYKEDYKRNFNN
jgi:hypothetical protein